MGVTPRLKPVTGSTLPGAPEPPEASVPPALVPPCCLYGPAPAPGSPEPAARCVEAGCAPCWPCMPLTATGRKPPAALCKSCPPTASPWPGQGPCEGRGLPLPPTPASAIGAGCAGGAPGTSQCLCCAACCTCCGCCCNDCACTCTCCSTGSWPGGCGASPSCPRSENLLYAGCDERTASDTPPGPPSSPDAEVPTPTPTPWAAAAAECAAGPDS